MTDAEYNAAKGVMYQKYKNGEISKYAYDKWKRENNPAKSGISGGAAAGDYGVKATDAAVERLQGKLEKVYEQAQEEIMEKLDQFTGKYAAKEARMLERLATGQIDQDELDYWRMGQVFQTQQWKNKVEQVTGTLLYANEQAMAIIDKDKMGVFVENANFQSYQLEKEAGMNLSFAIYDADTVARLIQKEPELLPRKEVDGVKDKAWNRKQIANSISQGIIQGETIPQIAKRIARDTSSANGKNMVRYARTAMTGAQNAGRIETLKRAQSMGIKVKKVWLATLDGRTRDSHREMDGQVAEPDGYFRTPLGSKMKYPGDLNGKGGDVWNCRCTLIYKYDDYPSNPDNNLRRDNETGELIQNMTYRQWEDWKKAGKPQPEPSELKKKLDAQKPKVIQKYEPDEWDEGLEHANDEIRQEMQKLKQREDELAQRYRELPYGPERHAISEELNKIAEEKAQIRRHIERKYGIEQTARTLQYANTEWVPINVLDKPLDEATIIDKLCGGDKTKGSCASLAFAYAGQKAGLDVIDFRGGDSQRVFARKCVSILRSFEESGANGVTVEKAKSYITAGKHTLQKVQPGKQYYFECGRHAAIVRKNGDNLEYLELQSPIKNGWMPFNQYGSVENALNRRFGAPKSSQGYEVESYMMDVDEMKDNKRLHKLLGYINTEPRKQMKGAAGNVK